MNREAEEDEMAEAVGPVTGRIGSQEFSSHEASREKGRDDNDAKARVALEKLLRQCRENRTTGEAYLRIKFGQGGIRNVFISVEGEVT